MKKMTKIILALFVSLSFANAYNVMANQVAIPINVVLDENDGEQIQGSIEYRDEDGNIVEHEHEHEQANPNDLARIGIQAIAGNIEEADEEGNTTNAEGEQETNENARQAIEPISADLEEDSFNPLWFVIATVLVVGGGAYVIKRYNTQK